jgi:hypothetical protein
MGRVSGCLIISVASSSVGGGAGLQGEEAASSWMLGFAPDLSGDDHAGEEAASSWMLGFAPGLSGETLLNLTLFIPEVEFMLGGLLCRRVGVSRIAKVL